MNFQNDKQLDNPVWNSLNQSHRNLAVDYKTIKFYHPDYCPFGGFDTVTGNAKLIDEYAKMTDNFFIVGEKPQISDSLKLVKEVVCLQMIIYNEIRIETREDITVLSNEHATDLYQLVNQVQPGYFKHKTALLGNYYGIFKNNELIAAAGERMKMDHFTEVSAIVTHPDHAGKGYAKQLVAHTVNKILDQNKTPYLHVVEDNVAAIGLYKRLGFKSRRNMSFWNIQKSRNNLSALL